MAFERGDQVMLKRGIGLQYKHDKPYPTIEENHMLVVLESVETTGGEQIKFATHPKPAFFYPAKYFRLYEDPPVQTVDPSITEESLEPFYLVWNKAGGTPNKSHVNRQLADQEASRLAAANPGKKFFVFGVVGAAQLQIAKDVSYTTYLSEQKNAEPAPKKSEGHYSYDIVDTGVCTGAFDFDGGIFDILIKNPEGVGLVHVEGRGATAFLEDLKEIEKLVGTDEATGTLEEMRDVYLSQYDFAKKSREFKK